MRTPTWASKWLGEYLYAENAASHSEAGRCHASPIVMMPSLNVGDILLAILAMFCSLETSGEQGCSAEIWRGLRGANR